MKRRNVFIVIIGLVIVLITIALLLYARIRSGAVVLGLPSGELTFNSDRTGVWDIFTINSDGVLLNLTDDGAGQDYFPSWSFDSVMVNFLTERTGEMGPGQVEHDGNNLHTLGIAEAIIVVVRDGRTNWDPAWSLNTDMIAWSSLRDFNLEIYVSDSDGENLQRITNDGGYDWFPAWSPDGTKITFSSDRDGNQNIYLFDLESTTLTQLTDDPFDEILSMWSLDGNSILYIYDVDDMMMVGHLNFFVMDVDGSNKRPLNEDEIFKGDPTYSADGSQIAYISNERGNWDIYVMDADGDNVRSVTDDESNDLFPVWRPVPKDE